MKVGRALTGGIVGTGAMSLLMAIARAKGMDVGFELMLGTFVGLEPGELALSLGIALQLVFGSLFALAYAWLFERVLRHGGMAAGLLLAIPHAAAAGALLAVVPAVHPLIPERMPAPGPFLANLGPVSIVALFVLHLAFGAIVGGIYGHVTSERPWGRSARI